METQHFITTLCKQKVNKFLQGKYLLALHLLEATSSFV